MGGTRGWCTPAVHPSTREAERGPGLKGSLGYIRLVCCAPRGRLRGGGSASLATPRGPPGRPGTLRRRRQPRGSLTARSPPTRGPRGRGSRFPVRRSAEHAQPLTTTNPQPRPRPAAPSSRLPIGCRGRAPWAQAPPTDKRRQWAWPRAGRPDSAARVHWPAA